LIYLRCPHLQDIPEALFYLENSRTQHFGNHFG
jgi:hypothetical protein